MPEGVFFYRRQCLGCVVSLGCASLANKPSALPELHRLCEVMNMLQFYKQLLHIALVREHAWMECYPPVMLEGFLMAGANACKDALDQTSLGVP
eukprot:3795341-Amphidinium_carterae.1